MLAGFDSYNSSFITTISDFNKCVLDFANVHVDYIHTSEEKESCHG